MLLSVAAMAAAPALARAEASPIRVVRLPSPNSPLVTLRLVFQVGAADDPTGREGLAALTAAMLGEGSTVRRTWSEVLDALYPMAADIHTYGDMAVLDRIIRASSNAGDLVLGSFNGSGTTIVLAALNGRRYIGIDQSAEYVDYAKKRLAHAKEQIGAAANQTASRFPVPPTKMAKRAIFCSISPDPAGCRLRPTPSADRV